MINFLTKTILVLLVFLLSCISCSDEVIQPLEKDEAYNLQFPSYFPEMTFDQSVNPVTKNGVELGRKLFYEGRLSRNNTISCGFCHIQENAFTDLKAKSQSNVEGKTVLRNSPSLYNAVFAKRFFYDLRAFYLEQQAEHVIYNEQEFNTSYESIIQKNTSTSQDDIFTKPDRNKVTGMKHGNYDKLNDKRNI